MNETDLEFLRTAVQVARRARERGNHPFGAILVGPDGRVLLEAENTVVTESDCTGHAETNLARLAARHYDVAFLSRCALYTSTEPCVMCSGAIYWSGIGRVVYALSAARLALLTGADPENLTFHLPCREVLSRGQRLIRVDGPAMEEEAERVHDGFWNA